MMRKNGYQSVLLAILLFVLLGANIRPVQAAEIDQDGKIAADEVINDDVFLTGDHVIMDGTVNGLLFASGETVTINGIVNGDALLFGNTIVFAPGAKIEGNLIVASRTGKIEGAISGSFFGGAAAVTMTKTASIGRNLYYGGYSFQAMPGSTITRDLFIGGYQATLEGSVQRDAFFGGAALEVSGSIGRNLNAEVANSSSSFSPNFTGQPDLPQAIAPGLRVDENAQIGGKLVYTSQTEQTGSIQAEPAGGLVYQTPMPSEPDQPHSPTPALTTRFPALGWLAGVVRNLVSLLAFGALALWLLPAVFQRTVDQARARPAPAAGYGVLAIFSGYFSAMLALVVILLAGLLLGLLSLGSLSSPIFGIGFSALALFVSVFTLLIGTGSKLVVAYLVGLMLIERAAPQTAQRQIWALIIGAAIYALVRSIPVVGWLFGIAVTLIGVGAMWLAYQAWQKPAVPAAIQEAA